MKFVGTLLTLAAAATALEHVGLDMFHDKDCKDQFMAITVNVDTCYSMPVGFSSYRINAEGDKSKGAAVTAYTHNNCGCPTCGSQGNDPTRGRDPCVRFPFVANAIGYFDPKKTAEFIWDGIEAATHTHPKRNETVPVEFEA